MFLCWTLLPPREALGRIRCGGGDGESEGVVIKIYWDITSPEQCFPKWLCIRVTQIPPLQGGAWESVFSNDSVPSNDSDVQLAQLELICKILHFWQVPRWCWCCWSEEQTRLTGSVSQHVVPGSAMSESSGNLLENTFSVPTLDLLNPKLWGEAQQSDFQPSLWWVWSSPKSENCYCK